MESIEEEKNKDLRDFLKIAFSSVVHLCTRMCPISEAGHFTPFSSAWIQHSYWYPSGPHMEQNVWLKFYSAINGPQGLIKAKEETSQYFEGEKLIIIDFSGKPWEKFTDYSKEVQVADMQLYDIQNLCLYKKSVFDKVGYADINYFPAKPHAPWGHLEA